MTSDVTNSSYPRVATGPTLRSTRCYGFLGAIVEQYEVSLFHLLSTAIAFHCLPSSNTLSQNLFYVYLLIPFSIVVKVLGGWFFGHMSDKYGTEFSLTLTIIGMAFCSFCLGILPTYAQIGLLCTLGFFCFKMGQVFCRGGEYIGAALHTLSQAPAEKKGTFSGFYSATYVFGALLASGVSSLFNQDPTAAFTWQAPFLLGALFSAIIFVFRRHHLSMPKFTTTQPASKPLPQRKTPIPYRQFTHFVLVTSGISALCCMGIFMGNAAILQQQLSLSEWLWIKQLVLPAYFIFLVFFGRAADKWGAHRILHLAFVGSLLLAPWLLTIFLETDKWGTLGIHLLLAAIAAAGFGPYHGWYRDLFPASHRARLCAIGYAIGSTLGGALPALAQYTINQFTTISVALPVIYGIMSLFAVIGLLSLRQIRNNT